MLLIKNDKYGNYVVNIPKHNLNNHPLDTTLTYHLHTVFRSKCDSLVELKLHIKPTTTYEYNQLWCRSSGVYHYGDHGKTASRTGIYRDTLTTPNQFGCDSIHIVHLTILETPVINIYDTICDNSLPYNYKNSQCKNLQELYDSGLYHDTLRTTHDCDSIIQLHLFVAPTYNIYQTQLINRGDTIEWENDSICTDTTITKHLYTTCHCDSIVTILFIIGEAHMFVPDTLFS